LLQGIRKNLSTQFVRFCIRIIRVELYLVMCVTAHRVTCLKRVVR